MAIFWFTLFSPVKQASEPQVILKTLLPFAWITGLATNLSFVDPKLLYIRFTLESGIEVGPTVINLAFFSRPYGLIRDYIKVI